MNENGFPCILLSNQKLLALVLMFARVLLCRCVREDEFGATMRCHLLKDGTIQTSFCIDWSEFFVPTGILLKALVEVTRRTIVPHKPA